VMFIYKISAVIHKIRVERQLTVTSFYVINYPHLCTVA